MDGNPVWSPDGRQLAFLRVVEGQGAAIFTVPSLGGQERKVVDIRGITLTGQYIVPHLSWAPDGDWLAYSEKLSADEPSRIVRLSLATLERQPLTSPPAGIVGDLRLQFSPDGRLLAFVRTSAAMFGNQDVWVQPVGGRAARRLATGQYFYIESLSWTGDGADVVFNGH